MPRQRLAPRRFPILEAKLSSRTVTLKGVQKRLMAEYRKQGRSWNRVALEIGISRGTVIRVAHGYEPKAAHIRRALGLPVYATVQVCPHCGKVHPPSKRHVSSNPTLLKFIREVAVPFLAARDHE